MSRTRILLLFLVLFAPLFSTGCWQILRGARDIGMYVKSREEPRSWGAYLRAEEEGAVVCPSCRGRGRCWGCRGSGYVVDPIPFCGRCGSTGRCARCGGEGILR
jgi:hypothetical protein